MTTSPCHRHRSRLAILGLGIALTLAACGAPATVGGSTGATGGPATGASDPTGTSPAGTSKTGTNPTGTSSQEVTCATPGMPTTVAYRVLPGIDPNLTSVDIHAPADACGAPVVMWVHGGGYQKGDKAQQMKDKVRLFNEHGWILVSVNYRLTAPGQPGSAQFPDHFDDVAAAVAWVHDTIAGYGGDPASVALLGHSAGADIVANVADNPTYLAAHGLGLDALVCAGPLDTEGFDKTTAGERDPDGEKEQWQVALGNEPDYLNATSATALVKPGIGIPPTIGVVRGTAQRQQIETGYLAALGDAGIATTSIDARTLSHNEVNSQIGAPGDTVMTGPVTAFLTGCFAG